MYYRVAQEREIYCLPDVLGLNTQYSSFTKSTIVQVCNKKYWNGTSFSICCLVHENDGGNLCTVDETNGAQLRRQIF